MFNETFQVERTDNPMFSSNGLSLNLLQFHNQQCKHKLNLAHLCLAVSARICAPGCQWQSSFISGKAKWNPDAVVKERELFSRTPKFQNLTLLRNNAQNKSLEQ